VGAKGQEPDPQVQGEVVDLFEAVFGPSFCELLSTPTAESDQEEAE
jgi:hypothetical protein